MNPINLMLSTFSGGGKLDSDDMKPVQDLFKESVAAWNRGDIDGYLHCYAGLETVRYISGGKIIIGKAAIAAEFKSRFPTPDLMGTLSMKRLEIDKITPTDALFYGEFQLVREGIVSSGVFTGHMQKFSAGWALVLDHSS